MGSGAQANCALQFNGQSQNFKACQDLSSTIGAPYNLLWSLTDEGNGSSIMSGALDVQSTGWAAFGLPQTPGSGMLGGSAVVVKSNRSAPSGSSSLPYHGLPFQHRLISFHASMSFLLAAYCNGCQCKQSLFGWTQHKPSIPHYQRANSAKDSPSLQRVANAFVKNVNLC